MGIKDALCFWNSKAFFALSRGERGEAVEKELGTTRPKDLEFVKGGKRPAYSRGEELWGKFAADEAKAKKAALRKAANTEDEEYTGEVPDMGKPLEDEEFPVIVEKSPRLTKREAITHTKFPEISTPRMGKHGLDS